MIKKIVYISSPYKGDEEIGALFNTYIFDEITKRTNFLAYAPLVFHYTPIAKNKTYDQWLEFDCEIVRKCDIFLLCLPYWRSELSNGMKKELQAAKEENLRILGPLYFGEIIDALIYEQNLEGV